MAIDGRYHWYRSCTSFVHRLDQLDWNTATDVWLGIKFGTRPENVHNLHTKDHRYQSMEKVAAAFSKAGDLNFTPLIIYSEDTILAEAHLKRRAHEYAGKALTARLEALKDQFGKKSRESFLADLLKENSFFTNRKVDAYMVKKILNTNPGTPTTSLDAMAYVLGLRVAYYSER